jgi:hypothetical protein
MSGSACDTFKAAITAAFGSSGPVDVDDGQLLHIHGCERCLEWLDAFVPEGLSDGQATDRLMSLIEKIDALAKTDLLPDATVRALHEQRDRREAELEAAVLGFIARHWELDPVLHNIPMERFEPLIFFTALDAVNMLIGRVVSRQGPQPAYYGLRDDGQIFVEDAPTIPAAGVQREILEFIRDCRIVPEEEKVEDLDEALRLERAWRDDETCTKLARWIVLAVRLKPDLMRNFRMIGTAAHDPRVILLLPIKTGTGDRDPVSLWNE